MRPFSSPYAFPGYLYLFLTDAALVAACRLVTMTSQTINEVLLTSIWACLSARATKNEHYDVVFDSPTALATVFNAAPLEFCPGLLSSMQASTPPSISFFRQLPDKGRRRWGIYAIVLKKTGSIPKVYIGSSTNSSGGIEKRFYSYGKNLTGNNAAVPQMVRKAVADNYEITHKGIIVWQRAPTAGDIPRQRLLLVAIEATLSFYFWTMVSRTKDYHMEDCCPWPRDLFTYHGLCTHSPLREVVLGDFNLSPEQLELVAAEKGELHRQQYREKYAKLMSDVDRASKRKEQRKRYQLAITPETKKKSLGQQRERYANLTKDSRQRVMDKNHRNRVKRREERRYYCAPCGFSFSGPYGLARHEKSKRHKNKVAKVEAGFTFKYRCDLCEFTCVGTGELAKHKEGKRHLQKVAKARAIAKGDINIDDGDVEMDSDVEFEDSDVEIENSDIEIENSDIDIEDSDIDVEDRVIYIDDDDTNITTVDTDANMKL